METKSEEYSGPADRITKSSCSCSASAASPTPRSIPELYQEKAHNLRVFTFPELRQATGDFSLLHKIGEGGFGSVFKGSISKPADGKGENLVVAIKKLNKNGLQVLSSCSVWKA